MKPPHARPPLPDPALRRYRASWIALHTSTVCALALAPFTHAANDTWRGTADGNWNTPTNWETSAPGATSGATNPDTATFNAAPDHTTIAIDAGRNLRNITFDTAGAGSHQIGDAGPNGGETLNLSPGGKILLTATVAPGVTQTFNSPLSLHGNYTVENQNTRAARLVFAGNITAAANTTLTVLTADTAATSTINTFSGTLANGTGILAVSLGQFSSGYGKGRVEFTGANTYTGTTTVNFRPGPLGVGEFIASGTNTSAGQTIVAHGTLTLNNAANGGLAGGQVTLAAGSFLRAKIAAAGTLANPFAHINSAEITGDHDITIHGTFTNSTGPDRPLVNSLAPGQKLTLNGAVYLSNLGGTGRVWQLRGPGETLITGAIADFNGGKGTAPGGIDFSTTPGGARSLTLAGAATYGGNTALSGGASTVFTLAPSGSMTFYIGANGVNNRITGNATARFNGTFIFDLTDADLKPGNSWLIVNAGTVIQRFADTFSVAGFTRSGHLWTNGQGLTFDETTGILSCASIPIRDAIPDPSTHPAPTP